MRLPVGITQQAAGGSGGVLHILDTFTDTNGVLIQNHTPDIDSVGTGWELLNGSIDIQSNRGRMISGSTNDVAVIDCGEADVIITVKGNFSDSGNGSVGIVTRAVDASNHWLCIIRSFTPNPWTWTIYRNVAGSWTEMTTAQVGVTGSGTLTDLLLRVTTNDESIRFEIPDENIDLLYESASTFKTATKHGLRGYWVSGTAPTFDDFEVNPL